MKRISKIITAITMSAVLLAGCGSSAQEQTQAPNAARFLSLFHAV
jgi:PBP1b-binding outer membrane lipoprotein LpoB